MSSLLEEAIVDAKALKEAALKNAENAVLEKYSVEVKDALSTLLEQDEFGLTEEGDDGQAEADTTFTEDVPFGFANETIDGPADNELIEIDFDQLKARIQEEEAAGAEAGEGDLTDALGLAEELAEVAGGAEGTFLDPAEAEAEGGEAAGETAEDMSHTTDSGSAAAELESHAAMKNLEEDEDIALTEDMLAALIEELVVDMTPRPQGWSSVNSADNSVEQANNDAMAAAQAAHLEEEEIEDAVGTAPDVVSDAELFESQFSNLKESTRELRALLIESKHQLTKLNLDNAKLVYQNKALSSASLNERQKEKIVEAVQSANSVEEATVIFETIQNAVGLTNTMSRTRPQTLREAVQRPTSLLINSQRNNEATNDPKLGRMLRLAGLTKQ